MIDFIGEPLWLIDRSLFLGEECIKPETTEKGWRICEQPTPPETIEKEKK